MTNYDLTPMTDLLRSIDDKLTALETRLDRLETGQANFAKAVAELMRANETVDDKVDSFILEVLDIRRKLRKDAV